MGHDSKPPPYEGYEVGIFPKKPFIDHAALDKAWKKLGSDLHDIFLPCGVMRLGLDDSDKVEWTDDCREGDGDNTPLDDRIAELEPESEAFPSFHHSLTVLGTKWKFADIRKQLRRRDMFKGTVDNNRIVEPYIKTQERVVPFIKDATLYPGGLER